VQGSARKRLFLNHKIRTAGRTFVKRTVNRDINRVECNLIATFWAGACHLVGHPVNQLNSEAKQII